MTLKEFIIACKRTSRGALTTNERLTNFALGLTGEVAELVEIINLGTDSPNLRKDTFAKEAGDVFWYLFMLLHELSGAEDFSTDYRALLSYGHGPISFVPTSRFWDDFNKSISVGNVISEMNVVAGKIADEIKKGVFHGKMIETAQLVAKLGNLYWLLEFVLRCFSLTVEEVLKMNIDKLKRRYPDGFSPEMSMKKLDENPDGVLVYDGDHLTLK